MAQSIRMRLKLLFEPIQSLLILGGFISKFITEYRVKLRCVFHAISENTVLAIIASIIAMYTKS